MEIIKIISEWKKSPRYKQSIKKGRKRVEAIVKIQGQLYTRHIDIKI